MLAGDPNNIRSDWDGDVESDRPVEFIPSQLVVKFTGFAHPDSLFGEEFDAMVQDPQLQSGAYLLELDDQVDPRVAARELAMSPEVEYSHPNYVTNQLHPVQGSYPFSDEQQVGSYPDQPAVDLLDLGTAHTYATGNGITIGIIDGGVDIDHAALDGSAVYGYDYVDDDAVAFDEADGVASGHGTFVAGVAHLIAPDAALRAYRVFDNEGFGDGYSVARAIEQAVLDGCRVINLSLVLMERHLAVRDAIDWAANQGVVVVAAAGNETKLSPVYPAAESQALSVAAVDSAMSVTDFTNLGETITICAPGNNVYSAYQGEYFAWWTGTSFSSPFVAGQAALLLQADSELTWSEVADLISASATNIDALNPEHVGDMGAGLCNPTASLLAAQQAGETAAVTPDTLFFEYQIGTYYFVPPIQHTVLTSTNAPAAYFAESADTGNVYVFLMDSVGYTNDTLAVMIEPYDLPEGLYDFTKLIHVDGVDNPVELTVRIDVLPYGDTLAYAEFNPTTIYFTSFMGTGQVLVAGGTLWSTNAPADFSVELMAPGSGLISLVDSMGVTNDSVRVQMDSDNAPAPGFYYDTIRCWVDGCVNPAVATIQTEIRDSIPSGVYARVWPYSRDYYSQYGIDSQQVGVVEIGTTSDPQFYRVEIHDTPDFVQLHDTVGFTYDSLTFNVVSSASLAPGWYSDTITFYVDSALNSPVASVITLYVADTSMTPMDTATAIPYAQYFEVEPNTPFSYFGAVSLFASNNPTGYTVHVVDDIEAPDFVTLLDTAGTTNDSVLFTVSSAVGLYPGFYVDTIVFDVDGVSNNPVRALVYLVVSDTLPPQGTATVSPYAQGFEVLEDQPFSFESSVFVECTDTGAFFTAHVNDFADFVTVIDTVGFTDDSVRIRLESAAGLPGGVYVDTLRIDIENASNSPRYAIVMLWSGDSTGSGYGTATTVPYAQAFEMPADSPFTVPGQVEIRATKGPAAYTVSVLGQNDFITLLDTAGVTDDTVRFTVSDGTGLEPGLYVDTLAFYVEDNVPSPRYAIVYLVIDTAGVPGDTVCCTEAGDVNDNGIAYEIADYAYLDSVLTVGEASYLPCIGNADVNFDCTIDRSDYQLMERIIFGDTLPMEGCSNCAYYTFIQDTVVTGDDSAWVVPQLLEFASGGRSGSEFIKWVTVHSTNAPAFVTGVPYSLDSLPEFVYLPDSIGMTGDSFAVAVDPGTLAPGWYGDSVLFYVEGIEEPVLLTVVLEVQSAVTVSALDNYPNPFNPSTTIVFSLGRGGEVRLDVYNILGRPVVTLIDQYLSAGDHSIIWDGRDGGGQRVSSGVYLYRLQAGEASMTKKMLLIK